MPLVRSPCSFACLGERLARTGGGPDAPVVGPLGETQSSGPSSEAGEEMVLGESPEIVGSDILNIPLVYLSGGDVPVSDEIPQPVGGEGFVLVVVRAA